MRLRIKDPKALRYYWAGVTVFLIAMLSAVPFYFEIGGQRVMLVIALSWFPLMGVSILLLKKARSMAEAKGFTPHFDIPKDPVIRTQTLELERRWYGITVGVFIALAVLAWLPIWPFDVPIWVRIPLAGSPYFVWRRMRDIERRFVEAENEPESGGGQESGEPEV